LPSPLPGVRRRCRGPRRLGILAALLALCALAGLPVGELAAAAPAGLPGVRRPALLVALAAECRLPQLRPALARANNSTLGAPCPKVFFDHCGRVRADARRCAYLWRVTVHGPGKEEPADARPEPPENRY
jgi:hypothetical protein